MNVLDWIKQEFDRAETFAEVKLLPEVVAFLKTVEQDFIAAATPFIATAAAELGIELTSGKPAAQVLDDMAATAKATLQKLESVGVQVATHDAAQGVNAAVAAYFASQQGKPTTAASEAVTQAVAAQSGS